MNLREELASKLDVDKNGKVNLSDAVSALNNRFGAVAVRFAFFGFVAGVVLCFVALKAF
jgi:hypothetical protein